MSLLVGYWHFEVETDQYDVIWFQKYIATTLRVNNYEIFQMVFEFLLPKIKFNFSFLRLLVAYRLNFLKKTFQEYQRIKVLQGISGAKSIYIKYNHHDYVHKKARYKLKHITEVSHKGYSLF